MFKLFRAAIAHDVETAEQLATDELKRDILFWKRESTTLKELGLLVKHSVLNDSRFEKFHGIAGSIDLDVLDKKPSLVEILAQLNAQYDPTTVEKAMQRAMQMKEAQLCHQVRNVDELVLQLSNRDDRRRKRK